MEVPTDPSPLLKKDSVEVLKKLEEVSQISGILNALSYSRARLSFHELTLTNRSSQRSKEIVVSTYRPWFAWMYRSGPGAHSISRLTPSEASDFKLASINPGDTIKIYVIADYLSFAPDVRVLHDGKLLELSSLTFDSRYDPFGVIERAIRSPIFYSIVIMLGFMMAIWLVVGLIYQVAIFLNPHFRAKTANKETIADWMRFLQFLKSNYPEKFKAASARSKK